MSAITLWIGNSRPSHRLHAVFAVWHEDNREITMDKIYEARGVQFQYPSDWELSEQTDGPETTITVSNVGTAFWSLTIFADQPSPEAVVESALKAYREEYEELDIYPSETSICNCETIARDLEFVCLELINSAFLRSTVIGNCTVLLLFQATDHELSDTKSIFEQISTSLKIEAGDGDDVDAETDDA